MLGNICIIPARGGSKRIPRKNIRSFCGKPMISYSIEAAINSNLFDEVMVSTDDEEIAAIAKQYGAKVPFMRSTKNADDFTGTGDVVYEVLNVYKTYGKVYDVACCIYATAPFVNETSLIEGFNLLRNREFDVVFPLAKYNSPIWRSYSMTENKTVKMNFPENGAKRSQDLSDAYYDAGQFYWIKTAKMHLLDNKNTFGIAKGAILLGDMEVQDIDNIEDWEIAEMKFEYLKNQKKTK
jgi:pseudaminic acid cytidylyltransferase